jgi:hypothetical protein
MKNYADLENGAAFLEVLTKLHHILQRAEHYAQAEFVRKLMELIEIGDHPTFVRFINSVDMWGGAGAVWEVYLKTQNDEIEFEETIVNLIDLMDKTIILGNGIKSIRKLFSKNLENR